MRENLISKQLVPKHEDAAGSAGLQCMRENLISKQLVPKQWLCGRNAAP